MSGRNEFAQQESYKEAAQKSFQTGCDASKRAEEQLLVKPFVKSNKNDRNDSRAIAEAVGRPDMKFVPIKTIEQQDTLLLHRVRQLAIKQRTAQANQIRGLLAEYGVIIPKGVQNIKKFFLILESETQKITQKSQAVFKQLYEQFKIFDNQVRSYDTELERIANQDMRCREIMKIEG